VPVEKFDGDFRMERLFKRKLTVYDHLYRPNKQYSLMIPQMITMTL
jgi:hypothetical protein